MRFKWSVAALCASALMGCASRLPPAPLSGNLPGGEASANPLAFELAARVAVSQAGKGETFKLIWQRDDARHVADVLSPLGTHVAKLRVDSTGARLDRGQGVVETAADDAALFQALFGVNLTLATLADWLHPNARTQHRYDAGGWSIETERDPATGQVHRLTATTDEGGGKRVRVVVDEYRSPGVAARPAK
jgi:outer membrane biogenesis lipoprotein LolB